VQVVVDTGSIISQQKDRCDVLRLLLIRRRFMQEKHEAKAASHAATTDLREQLFNAGKSGLITEVSIPVRLITQLNGIMMDLDLELFRPSVSIPDPNVDSSEFYKRYVSKWLDRHPVLAKAEVRSSGRGLHVLLWLARPITFNHESERDRWEAIVRVIQRILPIDANQPGIQALTRPVGSVNSRNNAEVVMLRAGEKVTEADLLSLVEEVGKAPFRSTVEVVFGTATSTCPICSSDDTVVRVLDRIGECYVCGKITRAAFLDSLLRPKAPKVGAGVNHASS